jgi:hypothetical protein
MPVVETAGRGETMELRFAVEQVPCQAALRTSDTGHWIDVHARHRRQIDHHAAVNRRPPGDVVTAASDGDLKLQVTRRLDGIGDVGETMATRDECRPLVDQAVVDLPGILVVLIGRLQDSAVECLGKISDRLV